MSDGKIEREDLSPEDEESADQLRTRADSLRKFALTLPEGDEAAAKLRAYADELETRAATRELASPTE
jgi:hypothetical protein